MTPAAPALAAPDPQAGTPADAADALALAQLVREAVAAGAARQALHLRLSLLGPRLRQGHYQRLVREALEPLLRPTRSRIFALPNGDVVAVTPLEAPHLREVEQSLAVLFATEPVNPVIGLRIPQEAAALLAAVEASLNLWEHPAEAEAPPPLAGPNCVAADLAGMRLALGQASLTRFLLRRPVCRIGPGEGGPALAWEEWGLAWAELWAALQPGAQPAAAPLLFAPLRTLAERRLLAELARPEEARRLGRAGLRLSLATLTEPEFLRLDATLGSEGRARMLLGLDAAEALADPEGFALARDFCRLRGWRVALDLASPALLPAFAEAAGVDLVRLRWDPTLVGMAAALPAARDRVVLTGTDRAGIIGWGWEAGVTLFEGRLLRPRG